MSFVEEYLNEVKALKEKLNDLQKQLQSTATYLYYGVQHDKERENCQNFDTYPIRSLILENPKSQTLKHFLSFSKNGSECHPSWAYAIETACELKLFDLANKIAEKVNKNTLNEYRRKTDTIWFTVAKYCPMETVKELVKLGLDPTIKGNRQWHAGFYAAFFNRLDILQFLVNECGFNRARAREHDTANNIMIKVARPPDKGSELMKFLQKLTYDN